MFSKVSRWLASSLFVAALTVAIATPNPKKLQAWDCSCHGSKQASTLAARQFATESVATTTQQQGTVKVKRLVEVEEEVPVVLTTTTTAKQINASNAACQRRTPFKNAVANRQAKMNQRRNSRQSRSVQSECTTTVTAASFTPAGPVLATSGNPAERKGASCSSDGQDNSLPPFPQSAPPAPTSN